MKIVHVGYEHRFDDTRIFLKECKSLQKLGHEVVFITSNKNGSTDEARMDGVEIKVLKLNGRRIIRQLNYNKELFQVLLKEEADLYFIHEVVLVGVGKKLLKQGKRVIYDMHENSPKQIGTQLSKGKGKFLAPLAERWVAHWEDGLLKKANGVLVVAEIQAERLRQLNIKNWAIVFNFPVLEETHGNYDKKNQICYAGGITVERGITNLVKMMDSIDCELALAGRIQNSYRENLQQLPGYKKVVEKGYLSKKEILDLYGESLIGMCTLLNTPNHYTSYPIKMFEYMNAGLPVVCSNFPNMKEIIETEQCGFTVDPDNISEIATAVDYLLTNREAARAMGERGRKAVREKYNWDVEAKKMLQVVDNIENF